MVDSLSRSARSALMSRIGGKNTAPELAVRRALHALGYRYRLHASNLPGRPDLVFPSRAKAVFVHGCFWHGHDCAHGRRRPHTNVAFWSEKARANADRDQRKQRALEAAGWSVLVVWECEVKAGTWMGPLRRFLGPVKQTSPEQAAPPLSRHARPRPAS
jgi:DNA mismatch endonuclease (patch repair protein)